MKFILPLAAAAFVIASPLAANDAGQEKVEPAPETQVEQNVEPKEPAPTEQPAEETTAIEIPAITAPDAEEEKRICRRIRTDMSSRRATRVCMTRAEWRAFNDGN